MSYKIFQIFNLFLISLQEASVNNSQFVTVADIHLPLDFSTPANIVGDILKNFHLIKITSFNVIAGCSGSAADIT